MDEFAERMITLGVNMSIGHTDATSDVALNSFDHGFSHVTHLYSATPSVRKINEVVKAGVIEAAYLDDRVTVELIANLIYKGIVAYSSFLHNVRNILPVISHHKLIIFFLL